MYISEDSAEADGGGQICRHRGHQHAGTTPHPLWRQPRGKLVVCPVNSRTNATIIGWHLWEIDLKFAPELPPGASGRGGYYHHHTGTSPHLGCTIKGHLPRVTCLDLKGVNAKSPEGGAPGGLEVRVSTTRAPPPT